MTKTAKTVAVEGVRIPVAVQRPKEKRAKFDYSRIDFRPLRDRILVHQDEAEETSEGGVILAETTQEAQQIGTVLAIGDGRLLLSGELAPLVIAVGERVHFTKFAGKSLRLDRGDGVKEVFLVMKEDDVLGVVRA